MGVCDVSVVSTLTSNRLNPTQRFVDLGWHSINAILGNAHDINTVIILMRENKDKLLFLKIWVGYVCLSKGINTDLALKLNKGIIMCVRELFRNYVCL